MLWYHRKSLVYVNYQYLKNVTTKALYSLFSLEIVYITLSLVKNMLTCYYFKQNL